MGFDELVESLGRRFAARTTRRSFIVRAGQVGVLVASGPALATLLTGRAEARVCGQSGVSPKCPTFDCAYEDSMWGWCWYASPGCCTHGGLKKICDCCTTGWPNVHGYCPGGANVRCIVESCNADPRVMYVPLLRAPGATAASVTFAQSRLAPPDSGGTLVLGDADDVMLAALAGATAGALGAAFLLTSRSSLDQAVLAEVQRRKLTAAVVLDSLPATYDDQLTQLGLTVERTGHGATAGDASLDAARWLQARTGSVDAACIEPTGVSGSAAAATAAFAGARKIPMLLGVQAAIDFAAAGGTYLVGPEAVARAGEVANPQPIDGPSREALAMTLATLTATRAGAADLTVHFAPDGSHDISLGLAGAGGMLQYHPLGQLGPVLYGFVNAHLHTIGRAVVGGTADSLGNKGIHDLQSALNQFDTHRLQGHSGQGLPVRSQPRGERPIGKARLDGPLPPAENAYWASRANPHARR
ncbi:MAG: hypothetical protein JF603_12420 [Acidobacteria bacterium]|nr:hypothetical protein [Acidobacteriota bacterium]